MSSWKRNLSGIGLLLLVGSLAGCERSVADALVTDTDSVLEIRKEVTAAGGASSPVTAIAEPTGFATLTGAFTVKGSVKPKPGLIASGEHAKICSPDDSPLVNRSLQVGANNGLANVAIWLTKPRKVPKTDAWINPEYYTAERQTAELTGENGFDQKNCMFLTRTFAMQNTQKLQIINSDPIGHNTKIEGDPAGRAAGANPNVGANSSVMYEPIGHSNQPFKVSCSIHNWMDAYMLVRPNPFFAVSDANGDFEIPHIPAGVNLEFRVSHEGRFLDEKNGRVVLTLNDEPLPIKSGRIKLSGINPGDELKLKFVLDAKANDWQ